MDNYAKRVAALEAQGMTTSDAQACVDVGGDVALAKARKPKKTPLRLHNLQNDMDKIKPGTALPTVRVLPVSVRRDFHIFDMQGAWVAEVGDKQTAEYVAATLNAYPQLVEDRRRLVEALAGLLLHVDAYCAASAVAVAKATSARALLRSLGESQS